MGHSWLSKGQQQLEGGLGHGRFNGPNDPETETARQPWTDLWFLFKQVFDMFDTSLKPVAIETHCPELALAVCYVSQSPLCKPFFILHWYFQSV